MATTLFFSISPKHVVYLMFRSNGGYAVIAARTKTTRNTDRAGESGEGEERTSRTFSNGCQRAQNGGDTIGRVWRGTWYGHCQNWKVRGKGK